MTSAVSTFTSDKRPLKEILDEIKSGKIQLPDFQRGWVWDDEHIRDLLASISLSYPIGTVMLLKTGGDLIRFKARNIEGAPNPQEDAKQLILDGQQRLTALFQVLHSEKVVQTKNARKKPVERWYYVHMRKALSPNGDRDEAIMSLPLEKQVKNFRGEIVEDYSTPEKEYENGLFPLNRVFDNAQWRWGFERFWGNDFEKWNLFREFEQEIIHRFMSYLLPLILIEETTPKEAVCQVFEKVNTGGVTLTVFELLTASFAAEEYPLRDDWRSRHSHLKKHPVLQNVESTDFLQAIALLVTYTRRKQAFVAGISEDNAPGISCKRKDILKLNVQEYQEWAEKLTHGFERTARFLHRQKIFTARDLPYRTQVVPLAAIMTLLGDEADKDGVQGKIAEWYWCGVLGELYGSAVESRFARDLPEVVEWVRGAGTTPKTVDDANFVPDRLYTLRTRNSAAYKGIQALLMRNGCQDFQTGETVEVQTFFADSIDIHHIFPSDWCDKNGIDKGLRDCIVNKTPLAYRTNRSIGSKSPKVYLEQIQRIATISEERMNQILTSHLITPKSLLTDNFDLFFQLRQEALLEHIEQAMGKSVIREAALAEITMDEDYETLDAAS